MPFGAMVVSALRGLVFNPHRSPCIFCLSHVPLRFYYMFEGWHIEAFGIEIKDALIISITIDSGISERSHCTCLGETGRWHRRGRV